MHEWLSGGVSPCQGEGRGFESRLVLSMIRRKRYPMDISFFVCSSPAGLERLECLRFAPVVAGERLMLYFFTGYAMHSSGKNSLAVGLSPYKIAKINAFASKLAGRYFHHFAWLIAFTKHIHKFHNIHKILVE